MDPDPAPAKRAAPTRLFTLGTIALAVLLACEYASGLTMGFSGDDFELLALARIGEWSPAALFVPHRGVFLKPVMNVLWAVLGKWFGTDASAWYGFSLGVHLVNAFLFGMLAAWLSAAWGHRDTAARDAGEAERPALGEEVAARPSRPRLTAADAWFGLAAAAVWAGHDRLAEPLLSISSLNHSFTCLLYLIALLALVRALGSWSARARLLSTLLLLPALFSYEIAASLIPAAILVVFFDPRGRLSERARAFGFGIGAATLCYAAIQLLLRLTSGGGSYYRFSPALAFRNVSEVGFAFAHIHSGWVAPGPVPALIVAAAVIAGLWVFHDRIVRFGLAWALAALAPIAMIPELSDRYHYIVFAGLTLAACRLTVLNWARLSRSPGPGRRTRLVLACAVWGTLLAVHLLWSFGGIREQTAYYRFKAALPTALLDGARSALASGTSDAVNGAESMLALAWPDDPAFGARRIAAFEARPGSARFGEPRHPVYVRPEAILGAVYPGDLLHVASYGSDTWYRTPDPQLLARAIAEGRLRIVPFTPSQPAGSGAGDPAALAPALASAIRAAMLANREIPLTVPDPLHPGAQALRLAYFERTDRRGAYEAEYAPGNH